MSSKWIVCNHHIAIEKDGGILHPSAEEVCSFLSGCFEKDNINSPSEELQNIRFSEFGSSFMCELVSTPSNEIELAIFSLRKNRRYPVDVIDGKIIDHCVNESEWFFLCGDVNIVEKMLEKASIKQAGVISLEQYFNLINQELLSEDKIIVDKVNPDTVMRSLQNECLLPSGLNAELYNYQKTGFSWMSNMLRARKGCILGDEMGLGKTLQIISVFQDFKLKGVGPSLVVAPVSLLENWKRECNKFAPSLDVFINHGPRRTGRASELARHDVVVISYGSAITDFGMLNLITWNCIVLDEAQNIKNPNSERAKSVKALNRISGIAVTGTPFENHITDIWSLADFVIPGLFGSLNDFKRNITDDVLGAKKIEPILSTFMIRRLVKNVANELPEKVVVSQPIQMGESEKAVYEKYRQDIADSVKDAASLTFSILQKLRMYCTHPIICDDEFEKDPYESSFKYQRFCEIVEEVISRGEKVIAFTSYIKMFDIFKRDIPKRFAIPTECINGETPVEQRQVIVDWFNNLEQPALLVLNPRAAGTGLNITGANHVIHYNLEWNPSLEDQSSARAYRRGQEKTVFIYRLFYIDTVEEVVNDRIERKREIAASAVVGTDGARDKEDIIKALKISPDFLQKGL